MSETIETITKKAAAIEVIKARTRSKHASITGMAAIFISMLFYIFSPTLGAGIAAIAVIALGVLLSFDLKEIQRLQQTYKLTPQPQQPILKV